MKNQKIFKQPSTNLVSTTVQKAVIICSPKTYKYF